MTEIFFSVGFFIATMELLYSGNLINTELAISEYRMNALGRNIMKFSFNQFRTLLVIRCLLVLIVLLLDIRALKLVCLIFILATILIDNVRGSTGKDGSDQMFMLIVVSLIMANISGDSFFSKMAMIFLAIQSTLSYFIAGFAKIMGTDWRNGSAVMKIFGTRTYGEPRIAALLRERKVISIIACWFTISFEVCFPLIFLLSRDLAVAYLLVVLAFHLINAIVMGLNSFLWAFPISYFSILAVHGLLPETNIAL